MSKIKINRAWAMPNKNTFNIKPIKNLIDRYDCNNLFTQKKDFISIDPFANKNKIAKHTNDIDKEYHTTYNLDALKFVKLFTTNSVDFVLYDPPYSPRQLSECYKKLGRSVTLQDTQSTFWSKLKKEISRVVKRGGITISFGWNSNGIGKNNGFIQKEILLVSHGGMHNDTICVVEKKI